MLCGSVRILDFDGSLIRQQRLIERFCPRIVDLRRIGPAARLWCDGETAGTIAQALQPEMRSAITFLGSGDYHHVSHLLISQFHEPLTVIVFDHHPDWDILPPRLACGSWVSRILERPQVLKVILLCVASDDLSGVQIHTGNLRALADDRVEIYPYAHGPTRNVIRRVPRCTSVDVRRRGLVSDLHWQEFSRMHAETFFAQLAARLETRQVYVSIDKDCLQAAWARTNWEEGCLGLDELLGCLRLIRQHLDIVGLDITGEYSVPMMSGALKSVCSRLDHPAQYTARGVPEADVDLLNERTNMRLLETLAG